MFLNQLKIKNFKGTDYKDLKFSKINLLSGINGSGKTTIVEALIGVFINHWEQNLEHYIKRGKNKFEIFADFSFYNDHFQYEIEYSKSTKRELILNDNKENPFFGSDCVIELKKYINPTIALFSNISLQGESVTLLKEKPTPRLEKLKQLFNIDAVDESINNIKIEIDDIKKEITEKEATLTSLKSQKFIYQDVPEIIDFRNLEIEIKNLEIEKLEYEKNNKAFIEYAEQIRDYDNYIFNKEQAENGLNSVNIQLENIIFTKEGLEEIEKNLQELLNKKNQLNRDLEDFDERTKKIGQISDELFKYEDEKYSIEIKRIKSLSFTQEEYNNLIKKIEDLNSKKSIAFNKYNAIKEGKCPTCGATYILNEIEKYKFEYENLKNDVETKIEQVNLYKDQKDKFEKVIHENEIARTKKESLNTIIGNLNKQLKETIEGIKHSNRQIIYNQIMEIDISIDEKEKLVNDHKEQLKFKDTYEKEKIRFQTILENLEIIEKPEEIKEPEEFDNIHLEELKKLLNVGQEREKAIKRIEKFNKLVKEQEVEVLKQSTEIENLLIKKRNKFILLESAKKLLNKQFTSYLIDKGTSYVKNKMNELFQKSYLSNNYKILLQKDSTGVDFYYTDETNIPSPVGIASGYEKQLLSVTFRLAMASLHKLGIFVFDEIDSDSDEDNSLKLYKTILDQNFNQLFIITHKIKTKDYLMNLPGCVEFEM